MCKVLSHWVHSKQKSPYPVLSITTIICGLSEDMCITVCFQSVCVSSLGCPGCLQTQTRLKKHTHTHKKKLLRGWWTLDNLVAQVELTLDNFEVPQTENLLELFSSGQDGTCVLRKAYMRSTLSLRRFSGVAFDTVLARVWPTMALFQPFKEDNGALPHSLPLSSKHLNWGTK